MTVTVGVAGAAAGSVAVAASVTVSASVAGAAAASVSLAVSLAGAMAVRPPWGGIRGRILCRGHRQIIARRRKAYCSGSVIRR
jgi:hypothetical protein